ncbi:ATP-dependent exoDNAse (exonuclease V) alpha subunit [Halospina denitrificans]|uniref:ATP-dependent exoDNAse (Exonuclease V) alpha subunit n=1 Tax=Halospina denitrificans TaxID=332522 RepID=A0A4R7K3A9_9GAMM|nr:AAA family ATPase [Halospina denitrificans]TDT44567.1 ATP-dependent exoDNAse (exonuclease V) alpha subunit [Halospina denitrificans]
MTTHMTLRLAWHNDGWNGRICQNPAQNTYCVGCASYPGELIREQRDLEWEKRNAGKKFNELDRPPPCMYSASAFAEEGCEILADPPDFFNDDTETRYWEIPPATACTWPYEAMYNKEGVKKSGGGFDYDKRLEHAEAHFQSFEPNKSLVFYYANYSNPLSDDENRVYVLVGVARIKEIAPTIFYDNCSERTLEKYKGFVWQRGITSHYPEQGLRLPYHRYLDQPDILQQFAAYPENTWLCKYATKPVSDDEALGLLEQLLESARIVRDDVQDDSENWDQRIQWLESLIAELWISRGAFPGMPGILEYLGLEEAISGFRAMVESGDEQKAFSEVSDFLAGHIDYVTAFHPHEDELEEIRRTIALEHDDNLPLMLNVLSRVALNKDQLEAILSEDRFKNGISAELKDLEANPYLLSEQYTGSDGGDVIRWSMVDRGMLPSPELSGTPLFKKNSKERIRALLLETIRGNTQQTFMPASVLIDQVNKRILAQPEWKQNLITNKYLGVDKEFYDGAIYQRTEDGVVYLYALENWDNERKVEKELSQLLTASDINLPRPIGNDFWKKVLFQEESSLAANAREEYEEAIAQQIKACQRIINKRFVAVTGGAGTGKSTVIKALIKAIYKLYGEGSSVAVVAPTGKATDRIRRLLTEDGLNPVFTSTIHSILAKYGWLNPNMTFRSSGGKRLGDYSTVIIDESSMIDLSLMSALFRALDWGAVSRLILVGDAAQLPPIGVGKLYADIVSHLRAHYPDHLVELTSNLRQLESRVSGKGHGILSLANLFINDAVRGDREENEAASVEREQMIMKLHEGGEIDEDLDVVYWSDAEALQETLINRVTRDLTTEDNQDKTDAQKWGHALKDNINCFQILSPVRGELYGTESINQNVQAFKSQYWLKKGAVDGITLFDKVIQFVNRPSSRALRGFDFITRQKRADIEIFNGEIGTVVPIGKWSKIKAPNYKVTEFAVQFSGKEFISVNYTGRASDKPEANLELAYAISVHKAQGSEFDHVYFVLPKSSHSAQYMELVYTALTRATRKCTVFVEQDVSTVVNAMRPEQSALSTINSSLFEFQPVKEAIINRTDWYEAGKIHQALTGDMVRSKSEVIIANMLHERDITFWYEKPLKAADGTMYLPDFTLQVGGEEYYWEHLGLLSQPEYEEHWKEKESWYEQHFPDRLYTTEEGESLSNDAEAVIQEILGMK